PVGGHPERPAVRAQGDAPGVHRGRVRDRRPPGLSETRSVARNTLLGVVRSSGTSTPRTRRGRGAPAGGARTARGLAPRRATGGDRSSPVAILLITIPDDALKGDTEPPPETGRGWRPFLTPRWGYAARRVGRDLRAGAAGGRRGRGLARL